MTKANNIKYILIAIAVMIIGLFILNLEINRPNKAIGSVIEGQEYNSTTTRSHAGTALTTRVLKRGAGSLGQITITGAGAGRILITDATTTNATLRTKAATTTIADIPLSAAAGTYTFDARFTEGLIYTLIGTAPTSTITWR